MYVAIDDMPSIYQILAALTGRRTRGILPATSRKWASTECHQFLLLHIWQSWHCMDFLVYIGIIDCPDTQIFNTWLVKHWFRTNPYCQPQSIQKCIAGRWIHNFNMRLLTHSTNKSLIWMYGWTRWATCRQPTQFWLIGCLPSNSIWVDWSPWMTTRTANVAAVQFGNEPGPETWVPNCFLYFNWCVMLWSSKRQLRQIIMMLGHDILIPKHGSSRAVSLLPDDVLLLWR